MVFISYKPLIDRILLKTLHSYMKVPPLPVRGFCYAPFVLSREGFFRAKPAITWGLGFAVSSEGPPHLVALYNNQGVLKIQSNPVPRGIDNYRLSIATNSMKSPSSLKQKWLILDFLHKLRLLFPLALFSYMGWRRVHKRNSWVSVQGRSRVLSSTAGVFLESCHR